MALDLEKLWDDFFAYVSTCPELTDWRAGYTSAELDTPLNPLRHEQGPPSGTENDCPEVAVDLISWPHNLSERSLSNRVNRNEVTFRIEFTVAAEDMKIADRLCLRGLKQIIIAFSGDGSYIDVIDTEVVIVARYGATGWDPENDDEQISTVFQDIIVTVRSDPE